MENNQTNNTKGEVTPTTPNNEDKGGKTFSQEEVNNIIANRLKEANSKNQEAIAKAVQEALAEAARKAKLTEEQRKAEAESKKEAELKERENSITLREMRLKAQEMLTEKHIPIELVDFVVDLDEEKTKQNVETFAKTYNQSVQTGVTDKLKGTPPTDFSNTNDDKAKKPSGPLAF